MCILHAKSHNMKIIKATTSISFAFIISFLAISISSNAQTVPFHKDVVRGELDNGLKYYILENSKPENKVELRLVVNAGSILETDAQQGLAHFVEHMAFNGTKNFKKNERIDVAICNPPFYSSHEESVAATARKNKNLHKGKVQDETKNFGGQNGELFCDGGESKFITQMIKQSPKYAKNVGWFTTLVSQESHLKKFYKVLKSVQPREIKTIPMEFGNKKSRILAWRF